MIASIANGVDSAIGLLVLPISLKVSSLSSSPFCSLKPVHSRDLRLYADFNAKLTTDSSEFQQRNEVRSIRASIEVGKDQLLVSNDVVCRFAEPWDKLRL